MSKWFFTDLYAASWARQDGYSVRIDIRSASEEFIFVIAGGCWCKECRNLSGRLFSPWWRKLRERVDSGGGVPNHSRLREIPNR